jgi:uncharacterized protein (TIGR00255 family)
MTGFGEADLHTAAGRLRVEVKTVNHRYFSANLRMPGALDRYEPLVREWLRGTLSRGHVNCAIRLETPDSDGETPPLRLDEPRARQYLKLLQALKANLDLPGDVDVAMLTRFSDLIVREEEERVPIEAEELRAVVENAARAADEMRLVEGNKLGQDLEERLAAIEEAMARIELRAPERLINERNRMRTVVADLAGETNVDEDRLAREIAHLADRWDISEELVRLRSHIQLFRELMASHGDPVGKRLSFLNQEMHREANTIGSKANDAPIEHQVVAIKNEIERLREQIENIE